MADVREVPDAAAQPHTPTPKRARGRSLSDFPEPTLAERRLIDACRKGEICDLGLCRPEKLSADTKIDAALVRFLALGGDESAPVHEKGVHLRGAWLDGALDLGDCDVARPIILSNCRVEAINADDARIPALIIESSRLERRLNGDRLVCKGVLSLNGDNFIAGEVVRLSRAEIGTLICNGQFEGAVNTSIGGKPERLAIDLSGATIRGDLTLRTRTLGWVCLLGANVGGNLICPDGRFENSDGYALICDHIKVAGNVFLSNKFYATGEVRFLGADIGGDLILTGAQFDNAGAQALTCDRIKVAGHVFLNDKFNATGAVRFVDAKTGGGIFCHGGRIANFGGVALDCERAEIAGDLSFAGRFKQGPDKKPGPGLHASGTVRLVGIRVGGNLDWNNGIFENPQEKALHCDLARIEGVFYARELGSAAGQVDLSAMHVGVLADDAASWQRVRGELVLDGFTYDRIAGTDAPTNASARIEWLKHQLSSHLTTEFRPQPWEQLISVLRVMGHPGEARMIAMEKQRHMLAAARMRLHKRPSWSGRLPAEACYWLVDRVGWHLNKRLRGDLIGFGYAPQRLLLLMTGLWVLFGLGYLWASSPGQGRLQPACSVFVAAREVSGGTAPAANAAARPEAKSAVGAADPCGPATQFHPFLYSLDALVPIDLGYQSSFKPADAGWRGYFRWIVGLEIALGWLGIGLLIAALTNLIKKD